MSSYITAKIPLIQRHPVDMSVKARLRQTLADGLKVEEEIQVDPGGDVERTLRIYRAFRHAARNLQWTTVAKLKYGYEKCLTGTALTTWLNIAATTPDEPPDGRGFEDAITRYKCTFLTPNDYFHQKLYLENMRKPETMEPWIFANRLMEMIALMDEFPKPEGIPPLRPDETCIMVFNAMPEWYKNKFQEANMNIFTTPLNEMIQYMSMLWDMDKRRAQRKRNQNDHAQSHGDSRYKGKKGRWHRNGSHQPSSNDKSSNKGKKHGNCRLHPNATHDWKDCYGNPNGHNYNPNFKPRPQTTTTTMVRKQEMRMQENARASPAPNTQQTNNIPKREGKSETHWMEHIEQMYDN
jgi:hypothetical protein